MKDQDSQPIVALVVPCYFEQEVIPETGSTLDALLARLAQDRQISNESFIVLVDDGSGDDTWRVLKDLSRCYSRIRILRLAANFGHQPALLAGLEAALPHAHAIISLDADLQDDIGVIPIMIEHFINGASVVLGVRDDRVSDSYLKRTSASLYYSAANRLGVKLVPHHADFRLLSSAASARLLEFTERGMMLRAVVPLLANDVTLVPYSRRKRLAGTSKYTFTKMVSLGINGIVSNTASPLRFLLWTGLVGILVSIGLAFWVFISFSRGLSLPGWASLFAVVVALTTFQAFALGLMGEYLRQILENSKARPRYIISDRQGI